MSDVSKDARTVFIRSVSFGIAEPELEEAFSDVGPVKQCFLVKVKGSQTHRGFGFVQYAIPEDAERAVEALNGKELGGRKLQVELANKRAPLEERKRKRVGAYGEAHDEDGDATAAHDYEAVFEQKQRSHRQPAVSQAAKATDVPADAISAALVAETLSKGTLPVQRGKAARTERAASGPEAATGAMLTKAAGQQQQQPQQMPGIDSGAAAQSKEARGGGARPGAAAQRQAQQQQRQKAPRVIDPATEAKHRLIRSVALGGLESSNVAAAVKFARTLGQVEEVLDPAPPMLMSQAKLAADGCTGHVVVLVYSSVKEAAEAVAQLHGRQVGLFESNGGQPTSKRAKTAAAAAAAVAAGSSNSNSPSAEAVMWARQVSGEGAMVKRWRIILRNLAFKVSEEVLRKTLSPAGFVWELKLPRDAEGRTKGFAFAAFTSPSAAEKAIQLINGKEVSGRMVVADWAVSKADFEAAKKTAAQSHPTSSIPGQTTAAIASSSKQRAIGAAVGEERHGDTPPTSDDDGGDGSETDDEDWQNAGGALSDDGGSGDDASFDEQQDQDGADSDEGESMELGGDDEDEGTGLEVEQAEHEESAAAARERSMLRGVLQSLLGPEEQAVADAKAAGKASGRTGSTTAAAKEGANAASVKQRNISAADKAADDIGSGVQGQEIKLPRPEWQGEEAAAPDAAAAAGKLKDSAAAAAAKAAAMASTVFVRNVPLDSNSVELQARLAIFGPVKAARLVMNKAAGKPKGTAFVEFGNVEAATKAAEACARGRRKEGPGITLRGQALEVDMAVDPASARSLAVSTATGKAVDGKDKRNMYLSKEGVIVEGSPAWLGMSQHDQMKRKRAETDKATKLQSPNFMVSNCRLSVRNIPHAWGEAELKAAFIAGVKARATKEKPVVRQVKILRDTERLDSDGVPKSKGLGFVEFADPQHALAALRQLNNNPVAFASPDRRPIVEFAIENVKIVKSREALLARQRAKRDAAAAAVGAGGADAETGAAARAARRLAKRVAKREAKKVERAGRSSDTTAAGAAQTSAAAASSGRAATVQPSFTVPAAAMDAAATAEAAALSRRQLKRGKQKDRAERKKAAGSPGTLSVAAGGVVKPTARGPHSFQSAAAAAGSNSVGATGDGDEGAEQPLRRTRAKKAWPSGEKKEKRASGAAPAVAAGFANAAVAGVRTPAPARSSGKAHPVNQSGSQRRDNGKQALASADNHNSRHSVRQRGHADVVHVSERKRSGDDEIERIAADALTGPLSWKGDGKRQKGGPAEDDRLDRLAAQYKAKLFGGMGSRGGQSNGKGAGRGKLGAGTAGKGGEGKKQVVAVQAKTSAADLKRWFE